MFSIFTIGMLISSCGGGKKAPEQKDANVLPAEITAMMPKGEAIYKEKCIACHQATGVGVENVFPPLANSDYLIAEENNEDLKKSKSLIVNKIRNLQTSNQKQ